MSFSPLAPNQKITPKSQQPHFCLRGRRGIFMVRACPSKPLAQAGRPLCLGHDMNVLEWNPAAERIFGWSEQEILGRPHPILPESKLNC